VAERNPINVDKTISVNDFLIQKSEKLTLASLNDLLQIVLPQKGSPTRDQIRKVLKVVGDPTILGSIVDSILNNPEELEKLSSTSMRHPIGMERITLATTGGYDLRFHLWFPDSDIEFAEDQHDHVASFGSTGVSGEIATDIFVARDGDYINMYRINSSTTDTQLTPTLVGQRNLERISPPEGIIFVPDTVYTMAHGVIHKARFGDSNEPIVRLNLRSKPAKQQSSFFRETLLDGGNQEPSPIDVEQRLSFIQSELKKR